MNRIALSLFLVALTTLMAELALVRIFDVIWYANKAYMIITMVMFCFGLAGVQQSLWPVRQDGQLRAKLAGLTFLFGLFLLALLPAPIERWRAHWRRKNPHTCPKAKIWQRNATPCRGLAINSGPLWG